MGTLFHSRQTAAALVWDGLPSVLGEFVLQSRNCRPFTFTSFDLFEVAGGAFLPQCLNYAAPLWFGFHAAFSFSFTTNCNCACSLRYAAAFNAVCELSRKKAIPMLHLAHNRPRTVPVA